MQTSKGRLSVAGVIACKLYLILMFYYYSHRQVVAGLLEQDKVFASLIVNLLVKAMKTFDVKKMHLFRVKIVIGVKTNKRELQSSMVAQSANEF